MDRAAQARLARLLGADPRDVRSIGGQHGISHYRVTLADGRAAFAKLRNQDHYGNVADHPPASAPVAAVGVAEDLVGPGAGGVTEAEDVVAEHAGGHRDQSGFAAEAASLRWLGEADAVAVPGVLGADASGLVIEWIEAGPPTAAAADLFGRELAALHAAGADGFGAPWPGVIARLPLPNDQGESWPDWYVRNRILPYVRIARNEGNLTAADTALIESAGSRSPELAGPPEPASRIHGDCWSGNVLWSGGRGWLIDPAAHGGHRETDLAMLALFGAPYLTRILGSYQETAPLADGWRTRVPLHQLHPLLVHVCLFGAAYREPAVAAARQVMAH